MKNTTNYLVNIFDGFAKAIFATIVIGTILTQIGTILNIQFLNEIGNLVKYLLGPAIGVGIASKRSTNAIVLISTMLAATIGAQTITNNTINLGNPIGALIVGAIIFEIAQKIENNRVIDMFLIPLLTIIIAYFISKYINIYITTFFTNLSNYINQTAYTNPLTMGIIISLIMAFAITGPMSSVALAFILGLNGIAAGIAVAATSAQMTGYSIMSISENGISGFLLHFFGTSKIQFKNIIKKPLIFLPTLTASLISGISISMFYNMEATTIGAGMGTSGLVGTLDILKTMGYTTYAYIGILVFHIALPMLISFSIFTALKKLGKLKNSDINVKN